MSDHWICQQNKRNDQEAALERQLERILEDECAWDISADLYDEVVELRVRLERYSTRLRCIEASCGIADPAEACHVILKLSRDEI